jgi:ADP-ribose pyrophosphatase YjhB (NUDIX family)
MFNPDQTLFLVGKESKWVRDIPSILDSDKAFIRETFSRTLADITGKNDNLEIAYYRSQVPKLLENEDLMNKIRSESDGDRITFGDIEYKGLTSFTRPRFLPRGQYFKFPGGGLKSEVDHNDLRATAIREFREEVGIHLDTTPFNINRLIDTGLSSNGYRVFYYITNEAEFSVAEDMIRAKNLDADAELYELQFIRTSYKISDKAREQYKKTPAGKPSTTYRPPSMRHGGRRNRNKKTRRSKQRWRPTRRLWG